MKRSRRTHKATGKMPVHGGVGPAGAARGAMVWWPLCPKSSREGEYRLQKQLTGAGLAGVAATKELVIVWTAIRWTSAMSSAACKRHRVQLWQLEYPAVGKLDYGNSPRATPLIHQGKVYVLGRVRRFALRQPGRRRGPLEEELARDFRAELPKWATAVRRWWSTTG